MYHCHIAQCLQRQMLLEFLCQNFH
ncbi:hypothetical protein [Flavobacterium antarcticum]